MSRNFQNQKDIIQLKLVLSNLEETTVVGRQMTLDRCSCPTWKVRIKVKDGIKLANQLTKNREIILEYLESQSSLKDERQRQKNY